MYQIESRGVMKLAGNRITAKRVLLGNAEFQVPNAQPRELTSAGSGFGNSTEGEPGQTGAALDHEGTPHRSERPGDVIDSGRAIRIGQPTHGGIGQPEPFRKRVLRDSLIPRCGIQFQLSRRRRVDRNDFLPAQHGVRNWDGLASIHVSAERPRQCVPSQIQRLVAVVRAGQRTGHVRKGHHERVPAWSVT